MANNKKENKIEKFTKEAIGKTLNQFNKEIGMADLVEVNKNQDRMLNGILSQINDENTEKTEKSNIITLDNSTDGIVELKEIQGDTNVNVSKIEEMPITHDIGDKEGNVFTLNEIPKGAISIGEIQGNTMVNCNKDDKKELILMKDLSTQGDNTVTLTEGVDGGLVDVYLEGNTLVNVSKTKDSTAITKAYTVENSGNHIALQGDADDSCRPVVTGNTLVNIISADDIYDIGGNVSFTDDYIQLTETQYWGSCAFNICSKLKPSTTYTLMVNILENTTGSGIYVVNTSAENSFFENSGWLSQSSLGLKKYLLTTKSDLTGKVYSIRTNGSEKNGAYVKLQVILLEGDYTDKPIPNYFEGLQSSFEDNLVTQEMVDNGEEIADNLGKYRVEYKVTREDGTVGNTKTLYLNSPLLEGDTIEEKDGGIYHVHRRSKVVLDGSDDESWELYRGGNAINEYPVFYYNIPNIALKHLMICDKIPAIKTIDGNCGKFAIGSHSSHNSIRICIELSKLSSRSVDAFKEWLQNNSTTVVYQLAEPTYELIEQSNLAIPSYANGHLDLTSAVPVSKVNFLHFEEELTYLYANTQYTLQFVSDKAIAVDITLGGTQLLAQSIVVGLNKISITTPATLVDNKLIISGAGANISEVVVTDTDREFGYFEGMKSVGECEELEVKSVNKNIFDIDKFINDSKSERYLNGFDCNFKKEKILHSQFKRNTRYIIRYDFNVYDDSLHVGWTPILGIQYEDGTKAESYLGQQNYLISNGNSIKYMYIRNPWMIYTYVYNISIHEDIQNLEYVEHKSNTQQLTHEPLRAVGDVKDRYVMVDGKWYIERNIKKINASDLIWTDVGTNSNFSHGRRYIWADIFTGARNHSIPNVICKDYVSIAYNNYDYDGECVYVSDAKIYLYINDTLEQFLTKNSEFITLRETPTYEEINYNPLEVYSDVTHISTNSAIPTNITIKNHGYNCLLKPSTTYTVSSSLGLDTVTTGSDIGDSCLRFYDEDTSDKTTMKDVLVLEGDWTSKADLIPSNFSGIESCFEQELVTDENDVNYGKYKVTAKVVGKNLFDIDKVKVVGNILDKGSNYIIVKHSIIDISYCCDFNPNSQYTLSWELEKLENNNVAGFEFIYTDGTTDYYVRDNKCTLTSIPGKTISKIRITFNNLGKSKMSNIQLEEGDTATSYEPYKESDVTFYIDEPLRGVENSKDRVFIQGDKVIVQRNCGSVTLDGSDDENWTYWFDKGQIIPGMLSCVLDNFIEYNKASGNDIRCICDTIIVKSLADIFNEGIALRQTGDTLNRIYVSIKNIYNYPQTVEGFKRYLSQKPLKLVYQLAEPVYEEVEYSSNRLILNTFNNESFNNSTLFLDTNISPKLSFKPLYEELVYVKNSTKYYIQFNAVGSGEVVINLGGTELTTEIVEGYDCIPITTPNESTNLMTISGQGITISEVVVSEVICGGYYKGLQSCFEEHMENGKYRVLLRGIALDGSKVNGIKLYINEPLRGIENTKDRLCIKNGKLMVERKCDSVALDGSEDERIEIYPPRKDGFTGFILRIPEVDSISASYTNVICNGLPSDCTKSYYNCTQPNIYKWNDNTADFVGVLEGNDVDVRQWLQQNPITIVYQLAEPIYEEATNEYGLPIVFEGYENGIVYIDSAVTPTTHIKYTSNNQLATTLAEAEEQNIATQEDINMNVVTYMMDIDMILTEMEMSNDISVMAVRRDSSNENMLDRMSEEDKKVYRDNTVVMLEKMITANVLEKEDIEGRIDMYYNKNRISKEQYEYLKSLL